GLVAPPNAEEKGRLGSGHGRPGNRTSRLTSSFHNNAQTERTARDPHALAARAAGAIGRASTLSRAGARRPRRPGPPRPAGAVGPVAVGARRLCAGHAPGPALADPPARLPGRPPAHGVARAGTAPG